MKLHPTLFSCLGASFALLSLTPAAGEETGILGTWRPVELDSDVFKQVEFAEEGGRMEMRVWNSVNGGEMAGSAQVVPLECSRSVAASAKAGDPPFRAVQVVSFKKVSYTISLTEKSLRVQTVNEYTDDSGRGKRESDVFFVRGSYREALTGRTYEPLTERGWLGIWKNRDEATRGIAQITIRELDPVTMSIWGIMGGAISSSPGVTVELPINGEDAASESASGRIEATADLEWAKITYSMQLHKDGLSVETKTDYTDPKRGDQTYEYEFVRGAWGK